MAKEWIISEEDLGCDGAYLSHEEIIRCRDCKHYLNSNEKCELIDTRLHFYETDKVWTADCFCAWAERRTDNA